MNMSDLKLVSSKDPILSEEMPRYEWDDVSDVTYAWDLAETMIEIMKRENGLGLSANQVGIRARMFVMTGEQSFAVFNPRIVDQSNETIISLEEGCLSFPNLWVKIKRPRMIKVRFQDPNSDTHTMTFDGMTARVFQHELDHLNGIDFTKRANRYHLEKAYKRKKKLDTGKIQLVSKPRFEYEWAGTN